MEISFMNVESDYLFGKELDRLHLNISDAVYSKLDQGWVYDTHKPTFTRIYAVIKGEGVIKCADSRLTMTEGNIYILPTGSDMEYTCLTEMEKLYFHVNLMQYDRYDMFSALKMPVVITDCAEEIKRAEAWMRNGNINDALKLKVWLFEKILRGFDMAGTEFGPVAEYSPLVKQAIRYVDKNLRSGLSVSEIVSKLYVSESRLQKQFRREVGKPLGKYITDRLFFEAEKQLRESERSIKEISNELGFCDPFYFSRCFVQRHGVPPSLYRKEMKMR